MKDQSCGCASPAKGLTCWSAAAEGRGRSNGWSHRGSKASAAMAWWSGHISPRHRARQGQRKLRLNLLLQGLLFSACSIRHEPEVTDAGDQPRPWKNTCDRQWSLTDALPWGKILGSNCEVSSKPVLSYAMK